MLQRLMSHCVRSPCACNLRSADLRAHNWPYAVQSSSRFGLSRGLSSKRTANGAAEPDAPDLTQKLLHLAWHPESNLIATAASNSLYMFCAA